MREAPFEITPMTKLEDRIEALESLVEDLRLRVAHVTPQCRVCRSTMWLEGDHWVCLLDRSHPELHDWSCQS